MKALFIINCCSWIWDKLQINQQNLFYCSVNYPIYCIPTFYGKIYALFFVSFILHFYNFSVNVCQHFYFQIQCTCLQKQITILPSNNRYCSIHVNHIIMLYCCLFCMWVKVCTSLLNCIFYDLDFMKLKANQNLYNRNFIPT